MAVAAAKQDAFEESIRLKNQFRNLDEDEVEFLDSVLESTRVKEAAVKEETTKQLKHFRRQQEESDRSLLRELAGQGGTQAENLGSPPDMESSWIVNTRKRKRNKEKDMVNIVKLRKSSSTSDSVSQGNSAKEERGISVDSHTASIEGTPHGEKPRTNDSPGDYKMRTTTITELISEKPTLPPQITTPVTKGTRRLPDLGLGSYSSDEEE